MRLENKIAIVTGAGSGFGKSIAEQYVAEGASVVVNDIDTDAGETVAASLGGERALFHGADVSKSDAVAALVTAAVDRFGGLDIFVNNAGVAHRRRPMLEVDEATFDRIFAMDRGHLLELERLKPGDSTATLRMFLQDGEVADPFGRARADYERCLDLIEQGTEAILEELRDELTSVP